MKKIYLVAATLLVSCGLMAQHSVTFQVDMNGVTVSPNGVHVAGDFQDEAGLPSDWSPNSATLTDGNSDGIYDVTYTIPAGRYEYKFINDNDWGGVESVAAVAQVDEGMGNDNRYMWINSDTTLPAVTFSGAAPAGMYFVKLKVDMRNDLTASSAPNAMGAWNNFSDPSVKMYDPDGDSIFTNYIYWDQTAGQMTYKFRNEEDWNTAESVTDVACGGAGGFGNDRFLDVTADVIDMAHCFGQCGPCQAAPTTDPVDVTFQVDMTNEFVCSPGDSVDVAGSFTNWGSNPVTMTDQGNGIWAVTITLMTNTNYEYKFRNRPGASEKWESSANRTLMFMDDTPVTLDAVCFEETGPCGSAPIGAIDVTFQVDMTNEVPGDTIWVIGSFTSPQWQDGAIPMTFSGTGGIFSVTEEVCPDNFQYKFVNGDPSVVANEEFGADTAARSCNVSNGLGGFNREFTKLSANDTTLPVFFFSTCDINNVGIAEQVAAQNLVSIYPNPFSNDLTIRFEDANLATEVMITDLMGKTIARINAQNTNALELSASDLGLSSGMYFVTVQYRDQSTNVYKVVAKN